jgi:hypothetical protein
VQGAVLIKLANLVLLAMILGGTLASAQTLTGTVTNGTTKKPAAGDEVILINLSNGMDVAGSTKADAAGKFSFLLKETGPHLLRAIHQGITYHQMAPPGVDRADVTVYDTAPKVNGISLTADVIRFQADPSSLEGMRLFVVNNASSPAKTQMNDHNFEFYLPPGAKVEQVQARAPNGQPIAAEAVPQAEKSRFAINFPLRPGETQFQLEFTVPYSGELKIDPKLQYAAEHFVVVTPKTMQFTAANPGGFQAMQDPGQGDTNVEVAQQTKPGEQLAFILRGTGTISEEPAQTANGAAQADQQAQGQSSSGGRDSRSPDNRPGGGLGAPIDAPDALQQYRWPILGGFAVLLFVGGWLVTKRQGAVSAAASPSGPSATGGAAPRATFASGPLVAPATGLDAAKPPSPATSSEANSSSRSTSLTTPSSVPPANKSAMLLEALKEEIFLLEVERKQGKISPQEYEKAKAALDQTLDRALKRQG